ncbi:MAG: RidA family protein [Bryobacteraceae bacterium]|jgi:enamine deaminase RidA (YjgF/YER057c/UK114 family)
MRKNISSGTRWEAAVGYSRAVRIGPHVWVAGTTAVDAEGRIVGEGDAYEQAAFILEKIGRALEAAGASLRDVVRTRMYLVSLEDEAAVGRAHAEVFREIRPAATMIQIAGLVDPRLRVEIEVEAYVES